MNPSPPAPSLLRRKEHLRCLIRKGLYLVTDHRLPLPELLAKTEAALLGGVDVVQFRDKERPARELLSRGAALQSLCRAHGALFIVNDHLDIALALEADGVHLGQDDLPAEIARRLAPSECVVGLSVHSAAESQARDVLSADYLGVGAMYPTQTKADARHRGVALLAELRENLRVPLVAIGGITVERVPEVIAAGADVIAVVGAVYGAEDPGREVRRFLEAIARARGE